MNLRQLFLSVLLMSFYVCAASAVSFETDIETGALKKNSIQTEHFQIEFSDVVREQTDSDGDGIADVIEIVAEAGERAYEVWVEDEFYTQPTDPVVVVLDDRNQYVSSGELGITSFLSTGQIYIALNPFLSEDVLKVTMVHEFYHVLQFSMGNMFAYYDQGINWAEATATWSEDMIYDDVDDYLNYLDDYFSYPDYSIFAAIVPQDTLFEYALSIWPRFLSEYYDSSVIQDLWSGYQLPGKDQSDPFALYETVNAYVDTIGEDLGQVYQEFALWNIDAENRYEEGESYPDVHLIMDTEQEVMTEANSNYLPALYGTNYLYFPNFYQDEAFHFQLVKPVEVEFAVSLLPYDHSMFISTDAVSTTIGINESMDANLTIANTSDYEGVVAVISALDADFENVSDMNNPFDEGFNYFYLAQYGEAPELSSVEEEVEVEEKEGEAPEAHSGGTDSLQLNLLNYTEDTVTIGWNRPSTETVMYEVHYWTDDAFFYEEIDKGYQTTVSINGLEEGEAYTFRIYAYDKYGDQSIDPSADLVVTPQEWLFSDLSHMDIHFDAISSLVDLGVFEGYDDGSFRPLEVINRAELLKILIEGRGIHVNPVQYKNCFPDVRDLWYAKYVCYAKEQGWVKGYDDGTYRPGQTVNKVEALKILFNVYEAGLIEGAKVAELLYDDLDEDKWYSIYVWKASQLGLLEESITSDFNPNNGRNRGEMAEELYRYLVELGLN